MLSPFTVFVTATIYMLLCGAVLGFMHRALPVQMHATASDWRIGTLLIAGGVLLLASRGISAVDWVIPIANVCILLGMTLYWRAVRRYFGLPERLYIYAPLVVTMVLLLFFLYVVPHYGVRVLISSLGGATLSFLSIYNLAQQREVESTTSGKMLAALMALSGGFMLIRGCYIFLNSSETDTLLLPTNIVNALTPLFISLLPTVGTSAFILLLFERIRRDLHRAATTDALTGLPNRRTIYDRARAFFAGLNTASTPPEFSVAVIDIDHFKQINDRYGHDIGDQVLTRIAKVLEDAVRGQHMVGRQGGEEFVALFDGAALAAAQTAAERIRCAVETADAAYGAHTVPVTVSIGVAGLTSLGESFDDLLRRADSALYEAKRVGRNCVRFAPT
jgi:diguanylate cyclase (GGDEF)-like protein